MDANRHWHIRWVLKDSMTEHWNLTLDDALRYVENQRDIGHDLIIKEQRPDYCSWVMQHRTMGVMGICTVWSDEPVAAGQGLTAGVLAHTGEGDAR